MPTVLSVTMAVGARLLAKKQATLTRLVAIEELAGVDVLYADKTGTLIQNKLTLGDPFSVNNVTAEQVVRNAALASRADNNDTIDLAVLGALKSDQALKGYKVTHFQPFDPVHKRTEATVTGTDGKAFKVTKGAPQVILALSANAEEVKPAVDKAVNEFAARGFRSLGVARADGDSKWQFFGVLLLFDPPREDAKATIATARQMGVKVKGGDRRCTCHRAGNRQEIRDGHQHPRCQRVRRYQVSRDGAVAEEATSFLIDRHIRRADGENPRRSCPLERARYLRIFAAT